MRASSKYLADIRIRRLQTVLHSARRLAGLELGSEEGIEDAAVSSLVCVTTEVACCVSPPIYLFSKDISGLGIIKFCDVLNHSYPELKGWPDFRI
jgi:hypothetical protein